MPTSAQVRNSVAEQLADFDADALTPQGAVDAIRDFAAAEKMLAARRFEAMRSVERRNGYVGTGARSTADLVSRATGQSMGRSAGEVAAAQRLANLPEVEAAARAGELSADQIQVVTDAACVDPSAQGRLLHLARTGSFKGLTDEGQRVRLAATNDAERQKRFHRERSGGARIARDGAFELRLRGSALDGARVIPIIETEAKQVFDEARAAEKEGGERTTYENRMYDAILRRLLGEPDDPCEDGLADGDEEVEDELAEENDQVQSAGGGAEDGTADHASVTVDGVTADETSAADVDGLGHNSAGEAGGPSPGPRTDGAVRSPRDASALDVSAPVRRRGKRKPAKRSYKGIFRIDHAAFERGHTLPGETSEIVGLGPVPVSTIKELMATEDVFYAAVIQRGHDVLNVAHLGRNVNVYQQTALEAISVECSNIGCNGTVGIENDHRVDWHLVHETLLSNIDPLCKICHKLKTHHGWRLEPGKGRRRFLPPELQPDPPPSDSAGSSGVNLRSRSRRQRGAARTGAQTRPADRPGPDHRDGPDRERPQPQPEPPTLRASARQAPLFDDRGDAPSSGSTRGTPAGPDP